MKLRTHTRHSRVAGFDPGLTGIAVSIFLLFARVTKQLSAIAMRLLAALALLTAQISASYSNTADPEQSEPSGRLALVIGNSAYRNVTPLKNPGNDAKLIAETLRSLGFEVVEKTDLTRKGFQAAVDEVSKKAGNYESVLFYFAGHGFQIEGGNYLVPVDSKLRDRKKFASETIDLASVIGKLEGENHNTLILLDACRNNPAKLEGSPTEMPEGLAQMETGNGTFVAFATQPGNITRDGAGENSPFSIALAEHMQTEGISISDMMIRVRNTVEERTAGEQTPWDQSSLRSQFYFNPVVEATDSLTEEDLALLEQLDPALREKFMKRFGLNLNSDGTAEGEEVVATVTPSLRIEADNAQAEEVAVAEESLPAESTDGQVSDASGSEDDLTNAGEARTAADEPPAEPRKPGLMVLAMPDEEPEAAGSASPTMAGKTEDKPQIVAMAKPEDVVPPIPAPAPERVVEEAEKSDRPTAESGSPAVKEQVADKASAQSDPSAASAKVPGSALSDLMVTAPLGTLVKQLPLKPEIAPAPSASPSGKSGQGEEKATANGEKAIVAPAVPPSIKPDETVSLPKPADEREDKPAAAPANPANPAIAALPKTAPAANLNSKPASIPAAPEETMQAPETIVALAKPVAPEIKPAVPAPVAAKPELTAPNPAGPAPAIAGTPAPKPVIPLPQAPAALNKAPGPASAFTLVPTPAPEKPATAVTAAPALTATPPPATVATAPAVPAKADEKPIVAMPDKAEEPVKPTVVAAAPKAPEPVAGDSAKAGSGQQQQPQGGGLFTATGPSQTTAKPDSAASPVSPSPMAPDKQPEAKEQLLAMADPVPATKLAPAATEAAKSTEPSTEPEAGKFNIPLPGDETDADKKQLAIKAQKELTRLGCFRNETDGDWGPRSARALLRFYAEQKLEPDQLEPTAELVSRLTAIDKVVCKNTETDRPKQATKKTPSKATAKTQPAPAKTKAPAVQKAQPKPKPVAKAPPPAVAKAPAPAASKKKISGGALIGAFR